MKLNFKILAFILITFIVISTQKIQANDSINQNNWTIFQLGIYPSFPLSEDINNVSGLKFGLPVSSGPTTVDGVELSVFGSATDYVNGVQIAPLANLTNNIDGVQISLINCIRENSASLNIGLINVAYFNTSGLQIGGFNMTGKETTGIQLGCYNFSETQSDGAQLGILNIANKKGLQFGLINIIKDSYIPCLPLFNYY